MPGELEAVLNEMKEKGIGGAVVRVDGVMVQSTLALNDVSSGLLSSLANVSDAIMRKFDDSQKDMEISFDESILVLVPVKSHLFCGLVKDREQKRLVLEYAEKAKAFL